MEPALLDLSREDPIVDICVNRILLATDLGETIMFSPLAQNFDLTLAVCVGLMQSDRRTIIGGNMAALVKPSQCSMVYRGLLDPGRLRSFLYHSDQSVVTDLVSLRRGRAAWVPSYRLLQGYHGKVPLLRLSASHGCLFSCSFCGDAWSQKLYVVDRLALEAEVCQFEGLFPETRLIYVGDKTFGQSKEAVANLLAVFESRPQYRFIIQTHIRAVNAELIEIMQRLGVIAVELGFETGSADLLSESSKVTLPEREYLETIDRIRSAGIRVILNVLGGLPNEREACHCATIDVLGRWSSCVFLYNLYNFVPYPLTPIFPSLRLELLNWNFADWREDAPPVFEPYHQTMEQSWERFLEKVNVAHVLVRSGMRRKSKGAPDEGYNLSVIS